eukprot:365934-Chlamydomonas_euryale.AAC.2
MSGTAGCVLGRARMTWAAQLATPAATGNNPPQNTTAWQALGLSTRSLPRRSARAQLASHARRCAFSRAPFRVGPHNTPVLCSASLQSLRSRPHTAPLSVTTPPYANPPSLNPPVLAAVCKSSPPSAAITTTRHTPRSYSCALACEQERARRPRLRIRLRKCPRPSSRRWRAFATEALQPSRQRRRLRGAKIKSIKAFVACLRRFRVWGGGCGVAGGGMGGEGQRQRSLGRKAPRKCCDVPESHNQGAFRAHVWISAQPRGRRAPSPHSLRCLGAAQFMPGLAFAAAPRRRRRPTCAAPRRQRLPLLNDGASGFPDPFVSPPPQRPPRVAAGSISRARGVAKSERRRYLGWPMPAGRRVGLETEEGEIKGREVLPAARSAGVVG